MCITCSHVLRMGVMIQIRNVPADLHRELKSRAALAGMSLSDYLLREIRQVAERPTMEQVLTRLRALPPVEPVPSSAEIIRAERDQR
jgi:antitoxin FitA